jgi:hypothetical protein
MIKFSYEVTDEITIMTTYTFKDPETCKIFLETLIKAFPHSNKTRDKLLLSFEKDKETK